jgi:type II secretory pathway component PulF
MLRQEMEMDGFSVKGVNPTGHVVELVILAESAQAAKAKAEEAGLRLVVVSGRADCDDPPKREKADDSGHL